MTSLAVSPNLKLYWLQEVVLLAPPIKLPRGEVLDLGRTKNYVSGVIDNARDGGTLSLVIDGLVDGLEDRTKDWKVMTEELENKTSYWINRMMPQLDGLNWRLDDNKNILLKYLPNALEAQVEPAQFKLKKLEHGQFNDQEMTDEYFTEIQLEEIPAGHSVFRLRYYSQVIGEKDAGTYAQQPPIALLNQIKDRAIKHQSETVRESCRKLGGHYEKYMLDYATSIVVIPHPRSKDVTITSGKEYMKQSLFTIDVPDYEWI
jgi:hypothetical protein